MCWQKVRAIERLRRRYNFCTPISGCFLETEDRSAENEPGSEGVRRGEMGRQKVRAIERLRRR